MERRKNNSIWKGAMVIAAGGLLAKIIGALYRIPLTNFIGGEGLGLYQLVYPLYCLLLTVSATGIPSSIATLTARRMERGESVRPLLAVCMGLFLLIGGIATVLMMALAPFLAAAQGEKSLTGGYLALAPSILLVSAISVLRGYFQGRGNMLPTAASEVVEQVVKAGAGLFFAVSLRGNVYAAVQGLLWAVTFSEGVALCCLLVWFRRIPAPVKSQQIGEKPSPKSILRLSIPVTLSAAMIPLAGMVDSIVTVRLLRRYTDGAVALYGLFSGGAVTLISLPVSVCYGIAAASVPALSAALVRGESGRKKLLEALLPTLALGVAAFVGLWLFASPAAKILYRSLPQSERELLVRLVKVYAVSAFFLSGTQTLAACLTAFGRPALAAISMAAAMAVKTGLSAWLVSLPSFSIFGAAIAGDVGYAISFLLDLFFAFFLVRRREKGF